MQVINIGSLNVDHVYQVDHFSRPGESLIARGYARFAGGKGANQSLAIARAGGRVLHFGKIGREGEWMIAPMQEDGVDTSRIIVSDEPGGHAMIQVDPRGQNSIVVFGGTNQRIETAEVDDVLALAALDDIVALQNEISATEHAMRRAARKSDYAQSPHQSGDEISLTSRPSASARAACRLSAVTNNVTSHKRAAATCRMSRARQPVVGVFTVSWRDSSCSAMGSRSGAKY